MLHGPGRPFGRFVSLAASKLARKCPIDISPMTKRHE